MQVPGDFLQREYASGVERRHVSQAQDHNWWQLVNVLGNCGDLVCRAKQKRPVDAKNSRVVGNVFILRLRNMTALDATGLFALEEVARHLHATKRTLILCGAREQPARLIHQAEFEDVVGAENICENVQEALRRAEEVFERLEAKSAASGK